MRTTVEFADDVASAVEKVRREEGLGVSEAVNELIRRGLVAGPERRPFRQRSERLGLKVDVSNIGEVLDLLEGPGYR